MPWVGDAAMLYEHYHRYLWAARLVSARRVLDLGCGEGYGSAILAAHAREVLGVDVDERAVEHAAANYRLGNLSFATASALDLGQLPAGSFDAVVAFEMIEHVRDQERVLAEIDRVLAGEGLLVISTPDRDHYTRATGQVNEFHEHELTLAEFRALLATRFGHAAVWSQRTIAGSYLAALERDAPVQAGTGEDFLVGAAEEGIEVREEPAPLFCVAVASRAPLPAIGGSSTLADYGLELVHETARAHAVAVAERDRLLGEANDAINDAHRELDRKREEVLAVGAKLTVLERELLAKGEKLLRTEHELADAQTFIRRVEESVTWQTFQRARGALYGTIGEDSRAGRALSSLLRLLGRLLPGGR